MTGLEAIKLTKLPSECVKVELTNGTVEQAPNAFRIRYEELMSMRDSNFKLLGQATDKAQQLQEKGQTISDFFWFEIYKGAMAIYHGTLAGLYNEIIELMNKYQVVRIIKE